MKDKQEFEIHDLEWTPEKIGRFWDYESQNAAKRGEYFAKQVGDAIVRIARRHGALSEPVLDYGSGTGHLTRRLVQEGIRCHACDYSPASVEALNRDLAGEPTFGGCERLQELPSGMAEGTFGAVFLIETLEHLLPEWRTRTLGEVRRLLVPGGHVVATVPFAEDLEAAKVICADCGAVFHRVQHVSSYDETRLAAAMAESGFEAIICRPMDLTLMTDRMQGRGKRIRRALRRLLARAGLLQSRREPTPNLVYIGKKAGR